MSGGKYIPQSTMGNWCEFCHWMPYLSPTSAKDIHWISSFLRASAMLKYVIDIGWMSVSPSVCLSVTRWHGIKTAELIVMISSPHNSPFILVLCIPRSSRNSDGVTPCGGAKCRWGIKIARFSTNKSLYLASKRYKISPWLLWKANRNSYAIYQMVSFPMTLNEP